MRYKLYNVELVEVLRTVRSTELRVVLSDSNYDFFGLGFPFELDRCLSASLLSLMLLTHTRNYK